MRSFLNRKAHSDDYIHTVQALSDRELFAHIAAGEEAALDELYKRYRSQVYRFLVHRTANAQAAEELVQEVFLAAWQGAGRFRGGATVKTWLLRVAYYRSATWIKTSIRPGDLELSDGIAAAGISLEDGVLQDAQTAAIRAGMAELSEDHRTAIELIFYHELTYREAARVVDCPVGTMKSRVNHAIKLLGGHLIRNDPER